MFVTLGIIFLGTMTEEDTWFDHRLVHSIIVFGKCMGIDPVYSVVWYFPYCGILCVFRFFEIAKNWEYFKLNNKNLLLSIVFSDVTSHIGSELSNMSD